jgi:hypothetical protein
MIAKPIRYLGHALILACDANCGKAWGLNNRPRKILSDDEDDYELLADGELGEAPAYVGTWEGADTKPRTPAQRLNKWCCRECERSVMAEHGEDFTLPDFSRRIANIPRSHPPSR